MQNDCKVPYQSFRRVVGNVIEGSGLGLAAWKFGGLEIGRGRPLVTQCERDGSGLTDRQIRRDDNIRTS